MQESPFKKYAGKPYMPSNGTEGMNFIGSWCEECIHQHPDPNKKPQCVDVLLKSIIGEQPKEWIYDDEGYPKCTKFKKWDWGNDIDGWNEPPKPEPDDPNQLCLPFGILETLEDHDELVVTRKAIFERESLVLSDSK